MDKTFICMNCRSTYLTYHVECPVCGRGVVVKVNVESDTSTQYKRPCNDCEYEDMLSAVKCNEGCKEYKNWIQSMRRKNEKYI